MRNVNSRFRGALILPILFFLFTNVSAQEPRVVPPPYVAECLATMTSYSNFITMRRAGITKDEAVAAFNTSLKLVDYTLKQQGKGPIPSKTVATQRKGIDSVYDLPEGVMVLNEALSVWMNSKMQACVEANAPLSPTPTFDPRNRMIPS